jgi:SSS family solute:Na+ symporter
VVVGLFCAGALAASMSTGDAIVHAAGSILVKDFYRVWIRRDMDDRSERRAIRFLVIVISGVAYYFAVFSDYSLVYLLLLAYGFIAQLFPLLLVTFFWSRATPPGVLAGLLAGGTVTVLWNLFPALQWQQIHPGIWGVFANSLVMVAVSLASSPMDEEHVAQFVVE